MAEKSGESCRENSKSQYSLLYVVGDADKVVPVSENTAVFEEEMERLGVPVTVIHKPGK